MRILSTRKFNLIFIIKKKGGIFKFSNFAFQNQGDVNKKIPDEPENNPPLIDFNNEIDSGVEIDHAEVYIYMPGSI